jgi:hypothetical protein
MVVPPAGHCTYMTHAPSRITAITFGIAVCACTAGEERSSDASASLLHSQGPDCPGFVVDGQFGEMDDPSCQEWKGVTPMRGRFGDLYVDVDAQSNLVVLNDWHLRDDAPAEPGMYNLFCLASEIGLFEIRVFGDQHVEAWLDGESIDAIRGASGFGRSPLTPTPHTIFEFSLGMLPSRVRILECDPAGGVLEQPALPPDVTLASEGTCFPGSAPVIAHNLVREPTIFEVELSPRGVRRATATDAPSLFGTSARVVEPGDELTLYGAQLGTVRTVRFGEVFVEARAWSDTNVIVRVPEIEGSIEVALVAEGVASNPLALFVRRSGCVPICGECGPDTCGGTCGDCHVGFTCDDASQRCMRTLE